MERNWLRAGWLAGWLVGWLESCSIFLGFAIVVAVAPFAGHLFCTRAGSVMPARMTPPVLKQYRMTGVATVKYGLYANYHRPPPSSFPRAPILWPAFFISSRPTSNTESFPLSPFLFLFSHLFSLSFFSLFFLGRTGNLSLKKRPIIYSINSPRILSDL